MVRLALYTSDPMGAVRRALRAGAPVVSFCARGRAELLLEEGDGEPVRSRSELLDLVRAHLGRDPLDGAGCFQDLIGARVLTGFDPAKLRAHLRFPERWLYDTVGIPVLRPVSTAGVATSGLIAAARAAAGDESSARVLLAHGAGWDRRELARAFGVAERTVRRWRSADPPPGAARALGLQLALARLTP